MTTGKRIAGRFSALREAERVLLAALVDEALVLADARGRAVAALAGRLGDAVGTLALSAADAGAERKTVALDPAALVAIGRACRGLAAAAGALRELADPGVRDGSRSDGRQPRGC